MAATNRVPSPAPDNVSIRDALTQHYVAHGLPPGGGADEPTFRLRLGSVTLKLPNPPARRRALLLHDVNHVATGYNTTFSQGEVAIAAFEIGAGCGRFAIVWFINLGGLAIGLLLSPRAVLAAYVRGRRSRSIYRDPPSARTLAETTVGAIRSQLHLDRSAGPATIADYITFLFWAAVSWVLVCAPVTILLGLLWLCVRAVVR